MFPFISLVGYLIKRRSMNFIDRMLTYILGSSSVLIACYDKRNSIIFHEKNFCIKLLCNGISIRSFIFVIDNSQSEGNTENMFYLSVLSFPCFP